MKLNLETSGASGVDATCQQAGEEAGGGGLGHGHGPPDPHPQPQSERFECNGGGSRGGDERQRGGPTRGRGGQLEPRQAQVIHMFYPLYFIPPL